MANVSLTDLFQAGAHYGHKTSRWHPKMEPYIHSARGGIHIINLEKTVELLDVALKFLEDTVAGGKQVLLVGTKRQAIDAINKVGSETGMPSVTVRWFGGLLTNYKTLQERVKHLKKLEEKMESGELANRYSKLEVQRYQEEIDQLNRNFGGVKEIKGLPGAVFVTDAHNNDIAVREANKLGIPVVAIVDTNIDPRRVDYPIPANDDAIKSVSLIIESAGQAIATGKTKAKKKGDSDQEKAPAAAKPAPSASKKPTPAAKAATKKE